MAAYHLKNKFDLTLIDFSLLVIFIFILKFIGFLFAQYFLNNNLIAEFLFGYFALIINIVVPFYYAKFKNKNFFKQIILLNKSSYLDRNWIIGILVGFALIIFVRLTPYWNLSLIHTAPKNEIGWISVLTFPVTILGFQTIILGPISEEFFFRGIVFNFFKNHMNLWWALILQGFVFATMHITFTSSRGGYDFLYYLLSGLVLGLLYEKTNVLITSLVCHGVINYLILVFNIYWK